MGEKNLLKYTLVCSVGVHLALLGLIGRTSATKPIDVEQLKIVRVDLVKTSERIDIPKPDQPKPETKAEFKPQQLKSFEPPPVHIPPVQHLKAAPPPKPKEVKRTAASNNQAPLASNRPAGDPGGHLNLGTGSAGGDLHLESGSTPVGHVASPIGGQGSGSGTGKGIGSPEPDPNASPGSGLRTAPEPTPSPHQPKLVDVTVCAVSHQLPGPYCKDKIVRSFKEADKPSSTCSVCKAPEAPKHQSKLADRAEPELVKDPKVQIPASVIEEGIDTRVTITYTVDVDGSVSGVTIVDSSGNPALDRAVLKAAEQMKYKPAVQDGVPRAVKKRRTYRIKA